MVTETVRSRRESKDQLYRYLNVNTTLTLIIQCQLGATTFPPDNQAKINTSTGQLVKLEPSKTDFERLIAVT